MNEYLSKSLNDLFMKLDIQMFAYSDTHYTYWYNLNTAQYRFYFVLTETVNNDANTSSLAVKGYIQVDMGSESSISFSTLSFASSINGSYTNSSQKSKTFTSSSSYLISTITHTIAHNADGTKSVSWKGRGRPYYSSSSWDAYTSTQTVNLTTIPRYATVTSFTGTTLNPSQVEVSWATNADCDAVEYRLNGGSWVSATGSGTSGTFTISGLTANTTYTIEIRVKRTDSQLWTTSSSISKLTHKLCTITSAANFNIGTDIALTIDRQDANYTCDMVLQARALVTDAWVTIKDDITGIGTSTTISLDQAEKDSIYELIPNQQSALIQIIVTTLKSAVDYGNTTKTGVATVVSSSPIFTDFEYEDVNATTLAITGDSRKLIKGYSDVKITVSTENKAASQNEATMETYSFENAGLTTPTPKEYSAISDVEETLNDIQDNDIIVRATDSRGLNTAVTKTAATFITYSPILLLSKSIIRTDNVDDETTLTFNGTYQDWAGLGTSNTILNAKYRYREVAGAWSGYTNITLDVNAAGIYSFDGVINGDLGATGFDTTKSFEIEVVITDRLSSITSSLLTLNSARPLLWKYKTALKSLLGIGKKPASTLAHGSLDVLGDINTDGDFRKGGTIWNPTFDKLECYPVGSVYMNASSNTTPATLFGGTWTAITDRFLIGSSGTYTNGTTGGATTVTLDETMIPSHTHTQTAHNHVGIYWSGGKPIALSTLGGNVSGYITGYSSGTVNAGNEYTGSTTAVNQDTGGGLSHPNMPPWRAVYMWYRSA